MIQSILDTDVYLLYIQNFILQHFPNTNVRYEFINRRKSDTWDNCPDESDFSFLDRLTDKIGVMQELRLSEAEFDFLSNLNIFPAEYLEYLKSYQFDMGKVLIGYHEGKFFLNIEGPWHETVLWETPLLAAICETVYENTPVDLKDYANRTKSKRNILDTIPFIEFGTRRRRSFDTQKVALETLCKSSGFAGTSNAHFAQTMGLEVCGTMAHQIFSSVSAFYPVQQVNYWTLKLWQETYKNRLNVALTDTFGTKNFFENFDWQFSTFFNLRWDSGDPISFTDKAVKHYQSHHINPKEKTIYYSDGLTPRKCEDIVYTAHPSIKKIMCLGTNLTNDVPDSPALQIVMKLTSVEVEKDIWQDVVKLTDNIDGKSSGNPNEIKRVRALLNI